MGGVAIANERIPIIRRDADGTIVDGTAAVVVIEFGKFTVNDFRDLDGKELELPPQSSFEFVTELPFSPNIPPRVNLDVAPYYDGTIHINAARYVYASRPGLWQRIREFFGKGMDAQDH